MATFCMRLRIKRGRPIFQDGRSARSPAMHLTCMPLAHVHALRLRQPSATRCPVDSKHLAHTCTSCVNRRGFPTPSTSVSHLRTRRLLDSPISRSSFASHMPRACTRVDWRILKLSRFVWASRACTHSNSDRSIALQRQYSMCVYAYMHTCHTPSCSHRPFAQPASL